LKNAGNAAINNLANNLTGGLFSSIMNDLKDSVKA
jgi:hypothetical protein